MSTVKNVYLVVNGVIFMCSRHKLMYELLGNTDCNIPATVHKSISEHLAAEGGW